MGAKYNWKAFGYWVEFTPFVYIRVNDTRGEYIKVKYEKWFR